MMDGDCLRGLMLVVGLRGLMLVVARDWLCGLVSLMGDDFGGVGMASVGRGRNCKDGYRTHNDDAEGEEGCETHARSAQSGVLCW